MFQLVPNFAWRRGGLKIGLRLAKGLAFFIEAAGLREAKKVLLGLHGARW
jgi:hypothetical protein